MREGEKCVSEGQIGKERERGWGRRVLGKERVSERVSEREGEIVWGDKRENEKKGEDEQGARCQKAWARDPQRSRVAGVV